jgi:hypothetical protein
MTLGLGLFALASPVLLMTDPIRQRDVAAKLSWSARLQRHAIVVPHPVPRHH